MPKNVNTIESKGFKYIKIQLFYSLVSLRMFHSEDTAKDFSCLVLLNFYCELLHPESPNLFILRWYICTCAFTVFSLI